MNLYKYFPLIANNSHPPHSCSLLFSHSWKSTQKSSMNFRIVFLGLGHGSRWFSFGRAPYWEADPRFFFFKDFSIFWDRVVLSEWFIFIYTGVNWYFEHFERGLKETLIYTATDLTKGLYQNDLWAVAQCKHPQTTEILNSKKCANHFLG